MNQAQIFAGIREVLEDLFEVPGSEIGPETTAADVDGWDSQAHVTLIVAIEQRFGIRFNTAELDSLHNVGELAEVIAAKCGRQP